MPIHESETDLALSFARLELTEVIAGKRSLDSCPGIKKLAEIGYGDYEQKAKDALLSVVPEIGYGEDPLGFVIACFVSQADRIKELRSEIENGSCRFNCRTQKNNEKKIKLLLDATMDSLSLSFGDLMTMEDWVAAVEQSAFIDYDGSGYYSDGEKQFRHIDVRPSMLASGKLDQSWSHIIWFNR